MTVRVLVVKCGVVASLGIVPFWVVLTPLLNGGLYLTAAT